jgi:hypothetical protein
MDFWAPHRRAAHLNPGEGQRRRLDRLSLSSANATTLYRTLSADSNPELRTLRAMLGAMGLRLSVTPVE